jgi:hypothetical protein
LTEKTFGTSFFVLFIKIEEHQEEGVREKAVFIIINIYNIFIISYAERESVGPAKAFFPTMSLDFMQSEKRGEKGQKGLEGFSEEVALSL